MFGLPKTICLTASMAVLAQANVTGYVKDVSNAGLAGVTVQLQSTGAYSVTDANGYFEIATSGDTWAMNSVATTATRLEGGILQFSMTGASPVAVSCYSVLGQNIYRSPRQMMGAGMHTLNAIPENANPGLYIVKLDLGSLQYTYKVKYNGLGRASQIMGSSSLQKTLAQADSLALQYQGATLSEKVAVYDDEATVDDIILSHKVVTGSAGSASSVNVTLQGSLGENVALTGVLAGGTYTATSGWMIYKSNRTWNVTASAAGTAGASASGVADQAQSITLDLAAATSSSSSATSTNLSYSATLDISATDYSFATVDLGAAQVASALGISTSELANVTYFAVNPDGTASSTASTAIDPGHWFDANGNVSTYDNGYVYAELTLSNMSAKVGQYPGKLTSGSSYTVKFGVSNNNKSVIFTVTLTITGTLPSSSSATPASSNSTISSSSTAATSSAAVATTITMSDLELSNPAVYKFVNWEWTYRLSQSGIVQGSDGTYDDYRTQNSSDLSFGRILNGKGTLKYCVIWEKDSILSKTAREQIRQMLNNIVRSWTDYLTGFEGWPYSTVNVEVTGWAVYDASYIQDKQSSETVYTSTKTDDMIGEYYTLNSGKTYQPYCPDGTYDEKFQIVDGYTSYSSDMWGFAGQGYWVAAGHVISNLGSGIPHIVAHESGHNFGLPDYYQSWDFPDANYSSPASGTASDGVGIIANASYSGNAVTAVMNSGSSASITEYDYWLLRKFWHEIKSKFGY